MDEVLHLESWRKMAKLPKLPQEDMEKLKANPRIRQLMESMGRRIVPVEKVIRARRNLIFERLSDPYGATNPKYQSVEKQIRNAERRQKLENELAIRREEVSKYEKQTQGEKDRIKEITKEIQKLSQNIEETEKKRAFLALYKEKLLAKTKDQEFLLDYLENALSSCKQRRNIVGLLTEYSAQIDLEDTIKECQSELKICLNHIITLKKETSVKSPSGSKISGDEAVKLKREITSFIGCRLKPFPWSYILQCIFALQEEIYCEVHNLLSDKASILHDDPEESCEAKYLKLLSACFMSIEADEKVKTWEDRYKYIREKYDEVCTERSKSQDELQKLHRAVDHEKPRINKKCLQLIAQLPKGPEKLWDSYETVAQLDIPQETLATCVRNLHPVVSSEVKLFAEIPLISLEYLSSCGMGRTESYKCLSQFERIPLHTMKFGSWAVLLEETCESRPHKLAFEVCEQIQFLVPLEYAVKDVTLKIGKLPPSNGTGDEAAKAKTETKEFKKILSLYNSFVNILTLHEEKFYKLPEVYNMLHHHPLFVAVPQNLKVQDKSIDEWRDMLKRYCYRNDYSL